MGPALVTWPGGRQVTVHQYRCVACGAVDLVKREFMDAHKDDKKIPWQAAAGDGRMFVGRPADKEVTSAH